MHQFLHFNEDYLTLHVRRALYIKVLFWLVLMKQLIKSQMLTLQAGQEVGSKWKAHGSVCLGFSTSSLSPSWEGGKHV